MYQFYRVLSSFIEFISELANFRRYIVLLCVQQKYTQISKIRILVNEMLYLLLMRVVFFKTLTWNPTEILTFSLFVLFSSLRFAALIAHGKLLPQRNAKNELSLSHVN